MFPVRVDNPSFRVAENRVREPKLDQGEHYHQSASPPALDLDSQASTQVQLANRKSELPTDPSKRIFRTKNKFKPRNSANPFTNKQGFPRQTEEWTLKKTRACDVLQPQMKLSSLEFHRPPSFFGTSRSKVSIAKPSIFYSCILQHSGRPPTHPRLRSATLRFLD